MAVNVGELEAVLKVRDQMTPALQKAKGGLGGFASAMGPVVVGLGAVASAAYSVVSALKAQDVQIEAINKMNIALANQGNLLPGTSKRLQEYASELQGVTKYGDEATIDLMARLAGYGMEEEKIREVTKATQDMATATGVDLKAAADLMGKAFAGETSMLSRYGIMIDKNLPKTEKFAAALEQVQTRFGGQAEAAAQTFTGRMTQLGNALGDTWEAVGKLFGSLGAGMDIWPTVIGWVEKLTKFIGTDLVLVIGELRARWIEMGAWMAEGAAKIMDVLGKLPARLGGDKFAGYAEKLREAAAGQRDLAGGIRETSNQMATSVGKTLDVANGTKTLAEDTEAARKAAEEHAKAEKERARMLKEAEAAAKASIVEMVQLTEIPLPDFLDPNHTTRATEAWKKLGLAERDVWNASKGLMEAIDEIGMGMDKLNDTQLQNAIKEMETLAETGDLSVEAWEYLGKLYTELGSRPHLKPLQDDIDDATKITFDFKGTLEAAADAAMILGTTGLGGLINDLATGALQGLAFADSLKKAMDAAGGFSNISFSDKAGAIGGMVQGAASIWEKNKKNLSGGKAALSGAASGAAMGSAFGPIGAGVGAIAGGLIGFFAGRKFRKIAKDAGKVLGGELSEETVSAIEETMNNLDLSAADAALLHIVDAAEDMGKSLEDMTDPINALMEGIADGSIPAIEGVDELGSVFSTMADEASKAGDLASEGMMNIIMQTRALGVEVPEVTAYVEEQLAKATEGVGKFVNALEYVSEDALPSLGENAGIIFGAMFDALVSQHGIVGAVDMLGDSFNQLQDTLLNTLGPEATNTILGPFAAAFDTLQDESLRPIFEGIQGITDAMTGLMNAGYLNVDAFNAMQAASVELFDQAIAGGADLNVSLAAIAPDIQAAIDAANRFGVPLSEDMQKLKELAEQNGYTFSTDPMDAMLDVMVAIAEVLGADIPQAAQRAGQAIGDIPAPPPMPNYGNNNRPHPSQPGGGDYPHLASGGIVTRPTMALIGEAGPEAVIPLSGGQGPAAQPGITMEEMEAALEQHARDLARSFTAAVHTIPQGG